MSKSTLGVNDAKTLNFVINDKKMQVYQNFYVDILPLTCNFIKNEAPPETFCCAFSENFQPATLLKTSTGVFL